MSKQSTKFCAIRLKALDPTISSLQLVSFQKKCTLIQSIRTLGRQPLVLGQIGPQHVEAFGRKTSRHCHEFPFWLRTAHFHTLRRV